MNPLPGTIGLSRIRGPVGWLIRAGQFLNGDASPWTHAFIVLGDGTNLGAYPDGAAVVTMDWERKTHGPIAYVPLDIPDKQRARIVQIAYSYVGTSYSFADYLALAAVRLRLPSKALRAYVADSRHMICSQLVDQIYADAGVQLFKDGREPGQVTPGDLARLL